MTERTLRPKASPPAEGRRPTLHPQSLADIDKVAEDLTAEITALVTAELKARLEHVSLHIDSRKPQEIVIRPLPYAPFFEVTTKEI